MNPYKLVTKDDLPKKTKRKVSDGLNKDQRYYRKNKDEIMLKKFHKRVLEKKESLLHETYESFKIRITKFILFLKLDKDLYKAFGSVYSCTTALVFYYINNVLQKLKGFDQFEQELLDLLLVLFPKSRPQRISISRANTLSNLIIEFERHPVKLVDALGALMVMKDKHRNQSINQPVINQ